MTAPAERLAVIGTDPVACARLQQALIDAKADEHGVLDAAPIAQAVLDGHAPAWPADIFLVLIGPADGQPDPATTTLRTAMLAARVEHAVVSGTPTHQLAATLSTWHTRCTARRLDLDTSAPRGPTWRHLCGRCGDGGCEARLFALSRPKTHTADASPT